MGANVIDNKCAVRRSISCYSLPALGHQLQPGSLEEPGSDSFNTNEEEDEERKQMYNQLRARKEALQDALDAKMSELKALCLREAELTGELPPEMPRKPNEALPVIRRRIRTEFALNDKLLTSPTRAEDQVLAKLELEFEIQSKIVAAQMKLMNEVSAKRGIRKKRKQEFEMSKAKLDMLEKQLLPLRNEMEESRKSKAVKRHLIQEMTMKSQLLCPQTTIIPNYPTTISYNNNGLNGNGMLLPKDGNNKKQKKQVRIKESNSTPSSPVAQRPGKERTMSGFVSSDIRSSLRANNVHTGRTGQIVDGFGQVISTQSGQPSFGSQPIGPLRLQSDSGTQAIDVRGKYDHLTREDIPNLNSIMIPMSPAKRRLMKTQAQRTANSHSIDNGSKAAIGHHVPLSKHGSIDAIDGRIKSRSNSESDNRNTLGKVLPRNPPPPPPPQVPLTNKMAQRPLPPTPGHGYSNQEEEMIPPKNLQIQEPINFQLVTINQVPDVVDYGALRKNFDGGSGVSSSSTSSMESGLMPPPPSLPPKVLPKKGAMNHRPSPLTIPDSISSSCDRNSISNNSSNSRSSITAESFLSIDIPMTPSYINPRVETPRPGPVPVTPTVNVPNADIVSLGQFQPYWEETKPYELSDFYKYSAKVRKQRQESSSSLASNQPTAESSSDGQVAEQVTVTSPTAPVVAGDFCDEMLDWYDGHLKNPTVV